MDRYFNNKVIWITGASSGIGEALAVELSKRGARMILSSRNKDELLRVKSRCVTDSGEKIQILPLDLAQPDTLNLITKSAIQLFGHVDVLINNGGISQASLVKDTDLSVDRKIMEVDYFGTIALSKYLLPHFLERGTGHYVVTSSVMGYIGTPYRSSYAAAKHALHGYFDSLRAEVWNDSKDIHVTMVCPGYVKTNVSLNALTGSGDQWNKMDKTIDRGLSAEYVARRIAKAIKGHKNEIMIAGFMERLAAFLMRYFPWLYARIIRRVEFRKPV